MKRWLVMGLLPLVVAGCATTASTPPAPDRAELLARASGQVLYRRPPEEVLEAARAVLNEHGYTVLPSSDPYYVRTGWKVEGNPDISSRWSRLLLQGRRLADGRFMLRAFEQVNTTVGRAPAHPSLGGGNRDANRGGEGANTNYVQGEALSAAPVVTRRNASMEWEVLSRLEPRFARTVERQVDVYVANHQPPEEVENAP
jgi:hypothetical protein